MNNPKVSVVITNWNGQQWLERCLNSLIEQTFCGLEIILVDNNSQDDSVGLVRKNYPAVKVIESEKNLGFAGGNNLGISQAAGEYIIMLNNDTWVEKDFVEKLLKRFLTSGYDVLAPQERNYEGGASIFAENKTVDFWGHPVVFGSKKNFYLCGVCLIFRKSLYQETLGLDSDFFMYFEETDWFWRLNLLNKKFGTAKDIFVYHVGGASSSGGMQYRNFLWRNQNVLQMLLKNYCAPSLMWVLPLYFLQNTGEILLFLMTLKFKVAFSYMEGWWFNLKNFKRTFRKRRWIQTHRIVGDKEILKKMYWGFGKIHHLRHFLQNK